ncbi:hypothetical protein D1006_33345 [Burkholderia stabilis]|uniref:Uncharacterized protein n=1 Tax=Burkholderia stabilis TaxID=95485 RepID=A0A4Q2A6Q4_9BURK|nr:hypothetical protein D1006_33345 [Burkholderia stabilis]
MLQPLPSVQVAMPRNCGKLRVVDNQNAFDGPLSNIGRKLEGTFHIKFAEIHAGINHLDTLRIDSFVG